MKSMREETFQIATLVVVVLTVLVCMAYILIFVNPQIALNPLRPRRPTPTAILAALHATWTPTMTSTPTDTPTPTLTLTPSLTPSPTNTPTNTLIPTKTRPIPTRTPRPVVVVVPTATTSPYPYKTVLQGCYHSGGTYLEGTVFYSSAGDPQPGIRVAMGTGPGPGTGDVYYVTSGSQGRSSGYYVHILAANGARPGSYYLWVADGSGNPMSDPYAGHVVTNASGPNDSLACWRAVVDFVRR